MTTLRCNMRCAHCCYACEPHGPQMDWNTFKAAADLAVAMDDRVALCGGEPTIHPLFWRFMEYALASSDNVWCLTNGKKTRTALALARLGQAGVVYAGISQDKWHEPIAEEVVVAFSHKESSRSTVEIRRVDQFPSVAPQNAGRCDFGHDMCPMIGTAFVDVDGGIHQCGCSDAPVIGTVFEPEAFMSQYNRLSFKACWKGLWNPSKIPPREKELVVR